MVLAARDIRHRSILPSNGACVRPDGSGFSRPDNVEVIMTDMYRIPKVYYQDHVECGCEAPAIIKATKQHFFISAEETEELAELRSRAAFYAEPYIDADSLYLWGLVASARATLKVIGTEAVSE
tara:strand:- start:42 stop:413 length:372 start_codon:yes stop_codon:yes gene_type:complete